MRIKTIMIMLAVMCFIFYLYFTMPTYHEILFGKDYYDLDCGCCGSNITFVEDVSNLVRHFRPYSGGGL